MHLNICASCWLILCTISLKYYYLKILYTFNDLIQYGGLLSTPVFFALLQERSSRLDTVVWETGFLINTVIKIILNSLCLRPLTKTRAKGSKSKRGENILVYSIISLIPFFSVIFYTRVVRVFDRALDKRGSLNISSQCLCYQTFS